MTLDELRKRLKEVSDNVDASQSEHDEAWKLLRVALGETILNAKLLQGKWRLESGPITYPGKIYFARLLPCSNLPGLSDVLKPYYPHYIALMGVPFDEEDSVCIWAGGSNELRLQFAEWNDFTAFLDSQGIEVEEDKELTEKLAKEVRAMRERLPRWEVVWEWLLQQ